MASTLIESKLIRKGGSRIDIDGTEYHFAPYTCGAHVCEVEDEAHADRFLSITEGFRLYRGEGQPVSEVVQADGDDERAALAAKYSELYGEAPHPRAGVKKLRELIAAKS